MSRFRYQLVGWIKTLKTARSGGASSAILALCSLFIATFIGSLEPAGAQPVFSKSFAPATIPAGGTSVLTFTIDNTGLVVAADNLDFTDNLPAGVFLSAAPNPSTTCNAGGFDATPGSAVFSYTGGSVPASIPCTVSVTVTSSIAGIHVNTTGDLTSNQGNSGKATASLTVEGGANATAAAIEGFLFRRTDMLAANGPDQTRWLNRLKGQAGAVSNLPVGFARDTGAREQMVSFATSLQQFGLAMAQNEGAGRAALQKNSQPAFLGATDGSSPAFDLWVEGRFAQFEESVGQHDLDGYFGQLSVGADYILKPNLLIGMLIQHDWAKQESQSHGSTVDGNGWMAGPYLMARIGRSLFFDGRAAIGTSSNTVGPFKNNPAAGVKVRDDFDTTRLLIEGRLTGDWHRGAFRFSPEAGITYVEERQESFTDAAGTFVPEQTVSLGQMRLGPSFAYTLQRYDGTVVEPHGSLFGIWNFDQRDSLLIGRNLVGTDDWRLQIEAGLSIARPSGIRLRASGKLDGLEQGAFQSYGGDVKISMPLQ